MTKEYTQLGERVDFARLENGLAIYLFQKPGFAKNFAFFATNYGGMDTKFQQDGEERDSPLGVAHFLEHKLFDMPDGGNALQSLSQSGASPNAFTGSAITGYYFEGSTGFSENLKTLLTFVSTPYFTKESVEKEQGIIGQEIGMIQDNPNWQLYVRLMQAMYETHPVKNSVAGSVASIAEISAETLYDCHKAFYTPSNMVLCVAADVCMAEIVAAAEEILPQTSATAPKRDVDMAEPPAVLCAETSYAMEVASPLFALGIKLPALHLGQKGLQQRLGFEILAEAICGVSSPLYESLYEKGLINRSFYIGFEHLDGCAYLMAGGESPEPAAVRDAIWMEISRIHWVGLVGAFL